METPSFVHLHVHSQYSLLDGKAAIKELVDQAIDYGMRGMALTDHGNMFGIKEFVNYVAKRNGDLPDDRKFKPILGCEMYVAKERLTDHKDKSDNGYHLIVLAKNSTGYHNLIKLVSRAWTDGFYYKPRTDRYELEKHAEGLIVCSACLGGEVPQLIMNGELAKAEERVVWFKNVFGDDYYLELQRHKTDKPNSNTEVYAEQQKVNAVLLDFAKKHGVKVVATNDVHFTHEDDAEAHDRLICVSMNKFFSDERLHYSKQEWLKSQEQMAAVFSDLPEALASTQEILDKVETYSIDHAPIMPTFDIPVEFGTEEGYRNKFTEEDLFNEFTRDEHGNEVLSREDADKKIARLGGYDRLYRIKLEADYLNKLTFEGAKERYGDPLPADVNERLVFELHIMKTMGFPGYFLIVQDFITAARRDLGVSVGPGRGSAAGSCAAYCLGITQIDPLKYDLLFERFLNPDRISLPDIDVDFDDDGRYEVLKYVTQKYGEEKVAHIITYQTMATKMAIRDMARVMQLPFDESQKLAKLVPERLPDVDGKAVKINFKNCVKYDKNFAAQLNSPDERVREVMKYAGQLEGNVRGTGIHACGVIIGRDDITDWVPISVAKDSDGSNVISTQYEGSVIEETGLIKMDFLGLKTLSIIKEALANIKLRHGFDLDIDNIPLDDPKTYKLYCDGNTTATFQFESPGMQQSLRQLQPSKFEDLIAMNALYRPGPMDYIPSFIKRKHGQEEIAYDIPVMKKYLEETYGITVYQEQVMLLSRLLAGFTRGESDVLRKAMGKKQLDKMAKLEVKFYKGGEANGYAHATLEKIWNDWKKFASYAFNKSHATCYSWVAYQTAYLKANYPAEYMAGVLSRNLTNSDKLKRFMDESKTMGIPVDGPDINQSRDKFSVDKRGAIRFGVGAVKGVGAQAVASIVAERDKNGAFKDIYDFVERVNLSACNRSTIENLALAGAFDSLDGIHREMFATQIGDASWADLLVKYGQRFQADQNSIQGNLFGDLEPIETDRPALPRYEPWSTLELLNKEKELVGIYLSAHPLDEYEIEILYGTNTTCAELNEIGEEREGITVAGLVTSSQVKISKNNKPYMIAEIEDYSGKARVAIFGRDYDTFSPRFVVGAALYITGVTKANMRREGTFDFNVRSVEALSDKKGHMADTLRISLDADFADVPFIRKISSMPPRERNGKLEIELRDTQYGRVTHFKSRKRIPLDREMLDMLADQHIPFRVLSSEQK